MSSVKIFSRCFLCFFAAHRIFSAEPRVPDGFIIEKVAGPPQIQFPMFAAFDECGRLFVTESSGGDLYAEMSSLTRRCRVCVLEDRDGDGHYETATVFADKLVFPMGIAVRNGKVYLPDGPDLIALEDTDGDGRADQRTVVLSGFGHSDNGGLHGTIFGPDGRLYMTVGQPDGYRFRSSEGAEIWSKAGALIRCRPDGSQPEVVARGFENLVEIVFLPTGEIIGSANWFQLPAGGIRDALVHLIEGGKYPRMPDDGSPKPRTGGDLPAAALFPAVAISGLTFYDGAQFPAEMRGQLFSAQHNSRAVQRHALFRQGASWRIESHDFLTSDDPDFHPSDLLQAPDGSLLVVDTGGWYVQHCPTGKILASYAPGGIYRVRHTRNVRSPAPAMSPADAEAARVRALGWRRDSRNARRFARWLRHAAPQVRLAAAEALSHCGGARQLDSIWESLPRAADRFEEHALIHAAHFLADDAALDAALRHKNPRVQKAALLLLDQPAAAGRPPRRGLAAEEVISRLGASDAELRQTAVQILQRHAEWAGAAMGFLRGWLEKSDDPQGTRGMILAFQSQPSAQQLVADAIGNRALPSAWRGVLLETLAETSLALPPSVWVGAIGKALGDSDAEVRLAAARTTAVLQINELDEPLLRLAENPSESAALRREALRALAPRLAATPSSAFEFLLGQLDRAADPAARLAAAELLARLKWDDAQWARVREAMGDDPLLDRAQPAAEMEALRAKLAAFEFALSGGDPARGREVFFGKQAACGACHRVGRQGGGVGPDLTKIGAVRSGRDLLESVLAPSATFAQGYEPWIVVLGDGDVWSGVIARQTDELVVLRAASGAETVLRREQIRQMRRSAVSLMPEGLERALSGPELRDLMAYLRGLK